jgi:hypothetical protein
MKTNPKLKPCPHCGSPVHWTEEPGTMKSFPALNIACDSDECFGGMRLGYDELGGTTADELKPRLAKHWNRRAAAPHKPVHGIRVCRPNGGARPFVSGTTKDAESPTGESRVWLGVDGAWERVAFALKDGHWNSIESRMEESKP